MEHGLVCELGKVPGGKVRRIEMVFSSTQPALRVAGVTKRFPGVLALDDVSLDLYSGEIHSLLGENGSGKSTLAKVIAGIYVPDEGSIEILGKRLRPVSPADTISHGIFYVPQSPNLIDKLTVTENVLLTLRSYGIMSKVKEVEELVVKEARNIGSTIDPEAEVGKLSYTQKQVVELVKASLLGARILLVDEVTTYLPRSVREKFYDYLKRLKSEGKAVLLITHKIPEAIEVADRITVMRSGRVVKTLEKREFDIDLIRKLMFENNGLSTYMAEGLSGELIARDEKAVIQLDDVWAVDESGNYALRGVRFGVRPREVLGIVGISGSGQKELSEVLIGLRPVERGRYYLGGVDVTNRGSKVVRAAGVGFISEVPLYYNLSGDLSLTENMALGARNRGLLLSLKSLSAKTREIIEKYGIVAVSPKTQVKVLSGGNVMKFAIAKELEFAKKALIALNPTRSLDEKSVLSFISTLKKHVRIGGLSVIYISESLDEVLQVSDTVAVINSGRIVGVFERKTVEREVLEKLMVM
ncbi:MAG: ATP-binding cassette domain-containing protein [Sulfolobales archaeon]